MKLFKTKYDITLDEVSLMYETGDTRILCKRRWIPAWMVNRYYQRFNLEFSELFNANEVSQLIDDDIMRLKIINRVNNILHPLYMGLLISDKPEFRQIYYDMFGRTYNEKDGLKAIIREIERLKGKMKEMGMAGEAVQSGQKRSFEEVITYVEAVLERSLDRDMKLYQFKHQYDLAVRRAMEYEKMKRNNG